MSAPADPPARLTAYERDGLTFDVLDDGPLDGDPVVLLHGFPERAASWQRVSRHLHDAGLRTYAPDQRGYSPRARPRTRAGYRIPALVADVEALVDRIGRPVHLVGHDWGALVAWAVASQRPDLVRSLTTASVPHPGAYLAACVRAGQVRQSWYFFLFMVPFLPELLARFRPAAFDVPLGKGGMTRDDVARFHREVVAYGALPGGLGWYRALLLAPLGAARRKVEVPTTYVWSDGDVALSRYAAERCGQWVTADYRYVVLEGVTHWIPSQAPDPLAEAVLARIASVA